MLTQLYQEDPEGMRIVKRDERIIGYLASRSGSRAVQIGPCMADAEAGPRLLMDACHRHAGRTVFVDIPLANTAAVGIAEKAGLTLQRHLLRMGRGPTIVERVPALWASSGPEKG
jgi:hypothetical protein